MVVDLKARFLLLATINSTKVGQEVELRILPTLQGSAYVCNV
jgi:hypothetical protein